MAFKWTTGGTADQPMASARQVREIIAGLPTSDSVAALQEVTEWLGSLNQTEGIRLNRRFENIDQLESAARNHQHKLLQDYLSTARQQKYLENRLWNCVYEFGKQLENAYTLCARQYDSGFSGITSIGKSLPVIMARALRALMLQLKWALFRYGPIESRIWGEIAGLYRLAEDRGFPNTSITIYSGAHGVSTIQREFLKAVMLAASSPDSLAPAGQDIAEQAIAHFVSSFRFSTRPEGCTHCFDLALAKPPVRLFNGAEPSDSLRFFGAGEGIAGVDRLTGEILKSGAVPLDVGISAGYERGLVIRVLEELSRSWSEKPAARSAERRQTASRITVVPGLDGILGTLEPAAMDDLDFSKQPAAESWIVENASDAGYGAIIPVRKGDWIRVGTLIGVKAETSEQWAVTLVRRIVGDEHQQRHVGLQLLAKAASPVRVARITETTSLNFSDNEPQLPAILLAAAPDDSDEFALVLGKDTLKGCDSLEMTTRGDNFVLKPVRVVESGEDFDWAICKVLKRSA